MSTIMKTRETTPYTIEQVNEMVENKEVDDRNVLDDFKGLPHEAIVAEHRSRQTDLVTISINMTHDFNKGTVLRTFSFFNGKTFYFLNKPNNQSNSPEGTKKWDRRGAVGVQNYVDFRNYDIRRYKELFNELRADGYTIYAVDNIDSYNPKVYYDVELPKKTVFVVGEEQTGIPAEIIEACDDMVYIPGLGVTPRSLNVSTAFAVIAADYMRQNYA